MVHNGVANLAGATCGPPDPVGPYPWTFLHISTGSDSSAGSSAQDPARGRAPSGHRTDRADTAVEGVDGDGPGLPAEPSGLDGGTAAARLERDAHRPGGSRALGDGDGTDVVTGP